MGSLHPFIYGCPEPPLVKPAPSVCRLTEEPLQAGKELGPAKDQRRPMTSLHPQESFWKIQLTTATLQPHGRPPHVLFHYKTLHRFPSSSGQTGKASDQNRRHHRHREGLLSTAAQQAPGGRVKGRVKMLPASRRDGLALLLTLLPRRGPFAVTDFGKAPPDFQKLKAGPHRHGPSFSLKHTKSGTKHSFSPCTQQPALLLLSPRLRCKPPSSFCYQFDGILHA